MTANRKQKKALRAKAQLAGRSYQAQVNADRSQGRAPAAGMTRVNLAQNPTVGDLAELIAACDDEATKHVLWVDDDGFVHIDPVPDGLTTGEFLKSLSSKLRFRWEIFYAGYDNVGPTAAADEDYVSRTLGHMLNLWNEGYRGYID